MDHPASLTKDQPWRSAALVASAIAALELFALVVVGLVYVVKPFAASVEARVARPALGKAETRVTPAEPAAKKQAPPALARDSTSVLVLNGNGITGAADVAAGQARRFHYVIAGTGNAPRTDFPASLVMYRPGFGREGRRLARDLGLGRVTPLDGIRASDLQGAHVALIVGRSDPE